LEELYHFQISFAVFSEHPEFVSKRLKLCFVLFNCKHPSEYLVLIYNNLYSAMNNISKNKIQRYSTYIIAVIFPALSFVVKVISIGMGFFLKNLANQRKISNGKPE